MLATKNTCAVYHAVFSSEWLMCMLDDLAFYSLLYVHLRPSYFYGNCTVLFSSSKCTNYMYCTCNKLLIVLYTCIVTVMFVVDHCMYHTLSVLLVDPTHVPASNGRVKTRHVSLC